MERRVPLHRLAVHVSSNVNQVPAGATAWSRNKVSVFSKILLGNFEVAFVAGDHETGVSVTVRHLDV